MKTISLTPPLSESDVRSLRAGDFVLINGKIFTSRDKAYKRVVSGEKPPVNLEGGVIYHCGPIVRKLPSGWQIVSAGPTTSARMDPMQAEFVRRTGVRALVGKGGMSEDVAEKVTQLGCVYLAFTGGVGVLAARQIADVEGVFWDDLGYAEAVWALRVKDFGPLVVAIDTHGGNLYLRDRR